MSIEDLFAQSDKSDPIGGGGADFGIESDSKEVITGQAEILPKKKRTRKAKKDESIEGMFGKSGIESISHESNSQRTAPAPVQAPVQQVDETSAEGISETCKAALEVLDRATLHLQP